MRDNVKYQDVYEKLRKIATETNTSRKLPSLKQLCDTYQVSLVTMNSALDLLEEDGLIRREARRGVFLTPQEPQQRSGRISLLMPGVQEPFFTVIIDTLRRYLTTFGLETVVTLYDFNENSEAEELRRLRDYNRIDGILYLPTFGSLRLRDLLIELAASKPVVQFDRVWAEGVTPFVGYEEFQTCYDAANHLISHGHRDIGLILANTDLLDNPSERLKGFLAALQDAGLSLNPKNVITYYYFDPDLSSNVVELLSSPQCPTAFFAVNNVYLSRFLRKAAFAGKRVPGDISFICVSTDESMEQFSADFTYFRQPTRTVVVEAAKLLLRRLKGETLPPTELRFPSVLVEGNSCRPR